MQVKDIIEILEAKIITATEYDNRSISSGFVGDLLSIVMGKAQEDCAWITIQSHMNIVAVATLVNISCIIVSEGFVVDEDTIHKAIEEELIILSSEMSSFEIASRLAKAGL